MACTVANTIGHSGSAALVRAINGGRPRLTAMHDIARIVLAAAALGGVFVGSVCLCVVSRDPVLWLYVAALCVFHYLEFFMTALAWTPAQGRLTATCTYALSG